MIWETMIYCSLSLAMNLQGWTKEYRASQYQSIYPLISAIQIHTRPQSAFVHQGYNLARPVAGLASACSMKSSGSSKGGLELKSGVARRLKEKVFAVKQNVCNWRGVRLGQSDKLLRYIMSFLMAWDEMMYITMQLGGLNNQPFSSTQSAEIQACESN